MILKQNICNGEVSVTQKCKQINVRDEVRHFTLKRLVPLKKIKKCWNGISWVIKKESQSKHTLRSGQYSN